MPWLQSQQFSEVDAGPTPATAAFGDRCCSYCSHSAPRGDAQEMVRAGQPYLSTLWLEPQQLSELDAAPRPNDISETPRRYSNSRVCRNIFFVGPRGRFKCSEKIFLAHGLQEYLFGISSGSPPGVRKNIPVTLPAGISLWLVQTVAHGGKLHVLHEQPRCGCSPWEYLLGRSRELP